uniref:Uncharacterized protein n=1 Tax=Arabidopsis thaliana TaxID=3702 RepID=Q0WQ62_ARATH|nr:hypothetical protein [Arabidopsis thaliana]
MIEDNACSVSLVCVKHIKLPTQHARLCVLHRVLPHSIRHSTPKQLHYQGEKRTFN